MLIARLVDEANANLGRIHLPTEKPLGEADLWWPPCVSWHKPHVDGNSEPSGDNAPVMLLPPGPGPVSNIYPSSLASSHFRLLHLTASAHVSTPIHIELEDYSFDDFPEYETVSYTWGGEDDDSTPCKAIFVGPFWDVMLATKNCLALLQYLRPRKGGRVVWLDAVCINQTDNVEKSAQISKMGGIYSACERVVVFLGEDLIEKPSEVLFRKRVKYSEPKNDGTGVCGRMSAEEISDLTTMVSESGGLTQAQLLQRRYLSRIWVVQELVLSQKAVLPVGCVDVYFDQHTSMYLVLRASDDMGVNAMQARSDLASLLKATLHCHSSDPRDRIFGVLGLFQPENSSVALSSDYSISWRDCWLGIGAYLVLVEHHYLLLLHFVGSKYDDSMRTMQMPSWIPDIGKAQFWFDTMEWELSFEDYVGLSPTRTPVQRPLDFEGSASRELFHFYKPYNLEHRGHCLLLHFLDSNIWNILPPSVNSTDGALRIQALRLFNGPCKIDTVHTSDRNVTSVWIPNSASTAVLISLMGCETPPSADETYHVFISMKQITQSWILGTQKYTVGDILVLFVTEISAEPQSVVSLRGCGAVYSIDFFSMDYCGQETPSTPSESNPESNPIQSSFTLLQRLQSEERVTGFGCSTMLTNWIYLCMFPCKESFRDLVPIAKTFSGNQYTDEWSPAASDVLSSFAQGVCPEFNPTIEGGYFYLTFKSYDLFDEWYNAWLSNFLATRDCDDNFSVEHSHLPSTDASPGRWTRLRMRDTEESRDLRWTFGSPTRFPLVVRLPLDCLIFYLRKSELFVSMGHAREFSNQLNVSLDTWLGRKPGMKDCNIFTESSRVQDALEDMGIVCRMEQIAIS